MKNALLKSFFGIIIFCNIFFFDYITSIFSFIFSFAWSLPGYDVGAIVIAVIGVGLFVSFLVYFFTHRDKSNLVMPVEFSSPDNMNPMEVGFLVDGIVDGSDVSAMLVYWAGEKYIDISNDKNKDKQKITKLVETLPEGDKQYEKVLFSKIFENNKTILVSDISQKFSTDMTITKVSQDVEKEIGDKYFDSKSILYRQLFICLFAFLFYFSFFYFGIIFYIPFGILATVFSALFVACADWVLNYYDYRHKNNVFKGRLVSFVCFIVLMSAICAATVIFFFWIGFYLEGAIMIEICAMMIVVVILSRHIRIYSKDGEKQLGKILGFKNFIQTAEADRIKMLVEQNPNFYYEVLPYAFVLGVSDKWIKHLNVIQSDYPNIVSKKMIGDIIVLSILYSSLAVVFLHILGIAEGAKSLFKKKKKKEKKSE